MKLVPETLNELQTFERGKNPKENIRIGISYLIPEINSYDLELLADLFDGSDPVMSYEDWYEDHGDDYENDEEANQTYQKLYRIALALDGKIEYGEAFDWKEEEAMDEYIENEAPIDKPYTYSANPDSDGWWVVFSSIELPSAEPI